MLKSVFTNNEAYKIYNKEEPLRWFFQFFKDGELKNSVISSTKEQSSFDAVLKECYEENGNDIEIVDIINVNLNDAAKDKLEFKQLEQKTDKEEITSGNKLKYYRELRGMSKYRLSQLSGVSQSHIGALERDIASMEKMTIKTVKELAKALNIKYTDLID